MFTETLKKGIISTYKKLEEFMLIADGSSMLPIIEPGDQLFIEKQIEYKIGDIIAFVNPWNNTNNIIVVHRIINRDGYRFFTKGDNQNFCDPPVLYDDILGKIIQVNKNNRGDEDDFMCNR